MRGKPLVIVSVLGLMTLLSTVAVIVRSTAAQEVKLDKSQITPDRKVFPEKARPTAEKLYEGRVRNILSRKTTFGFSVLNTDAPSEFGFYVENNEANRTIIETVMFAAEENRHIRLLRSQNLDCGSRRDLGLVKKDEWVSTPYGGWPGSGCRHRPHMVIVLAHLDAEARLGAVGRGSRDPDVAPKIPTNRRGPCGRGTYSYPGIRG